MSGPSQPATRNEDWSDERVKSFLSLDRQEEINPDFHALIKAYQAMLAVEFARFIEFFIVDGRDINGKDNDGKTILDYVSQHEASVAYADALKKAGAEATV
jgi:hypothetical protein